MELFFVSIVLLSSGLFFAFSIKTETLHKVIILYFIYVFFFAFPIIGAFIPTLNTPMGFIAPKELYLMMTWILLILLFVRNPRRIKFSRITVFYIVYSIYMIANSYIQGVSRLSDIRKLLLPLMFIITIENLGYRENDLHRFEGTISKLAFVVFIVSFIQLTFDHEFYYIHSFVGNEGFRIAKVYDGLYRNCSIFTFGRDHMSESGNMIAYMTLILLFLNFYRYKPIYLVATGLMLFVAFVTFTRWVWGVELISLAYFITYKYKKKIVLAALLGFLLFYFFYFYAFPAFKETSLYSERVTQDTYLGRVQSLQIYKDYFLGKNILFGWGEGSQTSGLFYRYGRHTVHDGLLEVLFKGGVIGFILFVLFLYQIYRKAKDIFRQTGNPVFLVFVVGFVFGNLTANFQDIKWYGYFLILFYMNIYYSVKVKHISKEYEVT